MGMRPSDNDIDREISEAEKYADAANQALALEAVTRWNKLMERSAARHKPGWSPMVGVAVAAGSAFSMSIVPAADSSNRSICASWIDMSARHCTASFRY